MPAHRTFYWTRNRQLPTTCSDPKANRKLTTRGKYKVVRQKFSFSKTTVHHCIYTICMFVIVVGKTRDKSSVICKNFSVNCILSCKRVVFLLNILCPQRLYTPKLNVKSCRHLQNFIIIHCFISHFLALKCFCA